VPFRDVSPTATVAERASAYGAVGLHVDGTDVDAVAATFAQAMAHARAGNGPVIVEATCFRFRGHFEGDPEGYRSKEERQSLRDNHDPISIHRARLLAAGVPEAELDAIAAEEKVSMKALLAEVLDLPMPDPAGALHYRFVDEVSA
jgi:pyruvate dehydrogenase E1 component alpha subunit